jgi:hypothetical protein
VNDDLARTETLRTAFQALGDRAKAECSADDLDRVWRAVAGELSPEERRALVDRLAADPALAEAWRVAHEVRAAGQLDARTGPSAARRSPIWFRGWMAAAAVFLVAVSGIVLVQRFQPGMDDTFRTTDRASVESLVPAGAGLPRADFRLRWTAGPPDTRYQVRVTTADLQVLTIAADLAAAEFLVPAEALSPVRSGEPVLWQVDATFPGGERVSSPTFTTRVQ